MLRTKHFQYFSHRRMYLLGCAGSFRRPTAATFLPEEGLKTKLGHGALVGASPKSVSSPLGAVKRVVEGADPYHPDHSEMEPL